MVKNKRSAKSSANNYVNFSFKSRQVKVILDKVLLFRLMQKLHGRFWGVAAVIILVTGFSVCGYIRPDLVRPDAAISDFGSDIRTAPYFAGTMFFVSYGLWRWRNYLMRTLKRKRPISWFIMLTIIGLYTVALMPVSWYSLPHTLHLIGFAVAGVSMVATVVADSLLSRIQSSTNVSYWRLLRLLSFVLIVAGGFVTFASLDTIEWLDYTFLGEVMMITGYSIWIFIKTYLGEGSRSQLSKLLKNIVLID